jgi:hypothetical protein
MMIGLWTCVLINSITLIVAGLTLRIVDRRIDRILRRLDDNGIY